MTHYCDIAKDFKANEKYYLAMAKGTPDEKRISKAYSDFEYALKMETFAQKKALNAEVVNIMNGAYRATTYKKMHKVNPYIVGGAVDGLIGPAAGVVSALDTMGHNDAVDAERKRAELNYAESQVKAEVAMSACTAAGGEVARKAELLFHLFCEIPEYRTIRDEVLEEQYSDAVRQYESGNYEYAIGHLSECMGYKDSDSIIAEARRKKARQERLDQASSFVGRGVAALACAFLALLLAIFTDGALRVCAVVMLVCLCVLGAIFLNTAIKLRKK